MSRTSRAPSIFFLMLLVTVAAGCADRDPTEPVGATERIEVAFDVVATAEAADAACWGQATRVFAALGRMGEHASSYETPRVGLRNLARSLYAIGALPDDSMESLGAFVAVSQGLSIDACM